MNTELQSKIDVNEDEIQVKTDRLQAQSLQALESLKQELVEKFKHMETGAAEHVKKVDEEMRSWTAGFCIDAHDELIGRGGQPSHGSAGVSDREPRSMHDKNDLAVCDWPIRSARQTSGTGWRPWRSTSRPFTTGRSPT